MDVTVISEPPVSHPISSSSSISSGRFLPHKDARGLCELTGSENKEHIQLSSIDGPCFSRIVCPKGKLFDIEFENEGVFTSNRIGVLFQPNTILAPRIFTFQVLTGKNSNKEGQLITPVLLVSDSAGHVVYLRRVLIDMPTRKEWQNPSTRQNYLVEKEQSATVNWLKDKVRIGTFHFSGIGITEREKDVLSFLRSHIDSNLFFEKNSIYFLMKQVETPNDRDWFELRFECRRFADWQEHDNFLAKENWNFFPLKQLGGSMLTSGAARVEVTVKVPVSIIRTHSLNETNVGEREMGFDVEHDSRETINYQFLDQQRNPPNEPSIVSFKFDNSQNWQQFHLLPEAELRDFDIRRKNLIRTSELEKFLKENLKNKWIDFLVDFFDVSEEHLLEFVSKDIMDCVIDIIKEGRSTWDELTYTNLTSEINESPIMRHFFLRAEQGDSDTMLTNLCEKWCSLIEVAKVRDAKATMLIKFNSVVPINREADSRLEDNNLKSLAKMLRFVGKEQLVRAMHEAVRDYNKYYIELDSLNENIRRHIKHLSRYVPEGENLLTN